MSSFDRIWKYSEAIIRHWKSLVSGCAIMVGLGLLQEIGQPVKWWIYFAVGIAAILVSTFKAWSAQLDIVEKILLEQRERNHQKSMEVIANINSRIVDITRDAQRFVFQESYGTDRAAAFNTINGKLLDFSALIEKNGIFLPQNVCDTLKAFTEILSRIVAEVGVYASIYTQDVEIMKKRTESSIEALRAFDKDIPDARRRIDDEFRKILGIRDSQPRSK